jgi:hypothetical protein
MRKLLHLGIGIYQASGMAPIPSLANWHNAKPVCRFLTFGSLLIVCPFRSAAPGF